MEFWWLVQDAFSKQGKDIAVLFLSYGMLLPPSFLFAIPNISQI